MNSPEQTFFAFFEGVPNPMVAQDDRFAAHMKDKQAAHPRMGAQGFELHLFLSKPTAHEIAQFHGGDKKFDMLYLHQREGLLMGLLELGKGLQFEFSYNAHPLKEQGAIGIIPQKENGFLMVFLTLTCSETFIVKGLRMATIGPQASDFLLNNINNQLLQGTLSESQAQQAVTSFEKLYPQLDMIKKIAPIRAKLGSKAK